MPDTNNNKVVLPKVNLDFKSNVEYAIQINRWLLKPLGAWPMSYDIGGFEQILQKIFVVACSFLLSVVLVPGSLYTFVKEKNTGTRVKLVAALSFCIISIFKYGSLITGRRNIGRCIEHLVNDWRRIGSPDDREIMLLNASLGRYGSIVCAMFMYGGGFFYSIVMPIVQGTASIPGTNTTFRTLAYPSYYIFFDPQVDPAYEIVFSIHCCSAFVQLSIAIAACSLALVFVMHACGQLEILMSWLNCLVDSDGKDADSLDSRISRIINHHVRVLRFISSTEEVLRTICLVEMGGCTINLCLLGHYLLVEWEQSDVVAMLTYTILLISVTVNILLFCYMGERLTAECQKVGETTYMIEWYRLPAKKALALVLTIAMTRRPTTITAGRLVDLSLNSFCQVIRTAVTYLNLLRTVVASS